MATRNQSDFQNGLQYLGVTLIETNISFDDFANSLVLKVNNPNQFMSILERLEQKVILKCKTKFLAIATPLVYIDFDTVIDDLNDKKTLQADLTLGFKLPIQPAKIEIPPKQEVKLTKSKQKA